VFVVACDQKAEQNGGGHVSWRSRFPVLVRRLPVWGRYRPPVAPLVPDDARAANVALREELDALDQILMPAFEAQERTAMVEQNRHRRLHLLVLFGGLLATVFSAAQASFTGVTWLGIVVAGVAATSAALSALMSRDCAMGEYVEARRRAEQLRSVYFRFLTSTEGAPAADGDGDAAADGVGQHRLQHLRTLFTAICHSEH